MIDLKAAMTMVDDLEIRAFRAGRLGVALSPEDMISIKAREDLKLCIEELIVYAAQLETRLKAYEP